jgi:hypothetical protein
LLEVEASFQIWTLQPAALAQVLVAGAAGIRPANAEIPISPEAATLPLVATAIEADEIATDDAPEAFVPETSIGEAFGLNTS